MVVKSRRVGKSVVITIPKGFNVPENKEYEPTVDDKGVLMFKPVQQVAGEEKQDIHTFMNQFYPLMEKLKDR
jgi:hypothetical protein